MSTPAKIDIVWLLEWNGEEAAFEPASGMWYRREKEPVSFAQLGARVPNMCPRAISMLLRNRDHRLSQADWRVLYGTRLSEVASAIRKALIANGIISTNTHSPLKTEYAHGYSLHPHDVVPQPAWVRIALGDHLEPLPHLSWMSKLVEKIREDRRLIRLPVLPGDGLEEVSTVLQSTLNDTSVITVSLGTISSRAELLDQICRKSNEESACADVREALARAARGHSRLVLLLSGWGEHEQRWNRTSVTDLMWLVKSFENFPWVFTVVLSPVLLSHMRESGPGSFTPDDITLDPSDHTIAKDWAASQLIGLPNVERQELITASHGHLGALRAALAAVNLRHLERLDVVRDAHEQAAERILSEVPSCCRSVLISTSTAASCVTFLRKARILRREEGCCIPEVLEWEAVWQRVGDDAGNR